MRNLMLMAIVNAKIHTLHIVRHVILMDHCALHAKKIDILNKTAWNAYKFAEVVIAMKLQHINA